MSKRLLDRARSWAQFDNCAARSNVLLQIEDLENRLTATEARLHRLERAEGSTLPIQKTGSVN